MSPKSSKFGHICSSLSVFPTVMTVYTIKLKFGTEEHNTGSLSHAEFGLDQ